MRESWKKERSKLGEFIDRHKISQVWLQNETKLSKNTLTRLCSSNEKSKYKSQPFGSVKVLIQMAVKKKVPNAKPSDLWEDM